MGDGSTLVAGNESTVNLFFHTSFGKFPITLRNALYMPSSNVNIIFVSQATERGYPTQFDGSQCVIAKVGSGVAVLKLKRTGHSYMVKATSREDRVGEANVVNDMTGQHESVF